MNMGFVEGEKLAALISRVSQDKAPLESLPTYGKAQQNGWRQLLGLTGGLQARADANPWLREHRSQVLHCLPGLGNDLASLARQLGLEAPVAAEPGYAVLPGQPAQ